MNRSRGFSLLEIMIAMVVVAIGIGVFLTVTSSNERKTNAESDGNNYSLLVNDIVKQFILDIKNCEGSSSEGHCSELGASGKTTSTDVYDYFHNRGITLSDAQIKALKAQGIDVYNSQSIQIDIEKPTASDVA